MVTSLLLAAGGGTASRGQGDCIEIRYNNIAIWGPKAKEYMKDARGSCHIQALGEVYIASKGRDKFMKDIRECKWKGDIAPAASGGGTSGGVGLCLSPHLQLAAMRQATQAGAVYAKGPDWIAVNLRTRGLSVLTLSLYRTCSIGVTGENLDKLHALVKFLALEELPYLILADWNVAPSRLYDSNIFRDITGVIITPRLAQHTCASGGLLDYVVASASIQPAVWLLELNHASPFKPHSGLKLILNGQAEESHGQEDDRAREI